MMDLVEYARESGWEPEAVLSPEIFEEVRAARKMRPPIPWEHILLWLKEVHQITGVSETSLRRRVIRAT